MSTKLDFSNFFHCFNCVVRWKKGVFSAIINLQLCPFEYFILENLFTKFRGFTVGEK